MSFRHQEANANIFNFFPQEKIHVCIQYNTTHTQRHTRTRAHTHTHISNLERSNCKKYSLSFADALCCSLGYAGRLHYLVSPSIDCHHYSNFYYSVHKVSLLNPLFLTVLSKFVPNIFTTLYFKRTEPLN